MFPPEVAIICPLHGLEQPCLGWLIPATSSLGAAPDFRVNKRNDGSTWPGWRLNRLVQPETSATYVHHPTSANGWLADLHSKQRTKKVSMQKPFHYTHHTEEIRCHSAAPSSASSILQDLKWTVCSSWIPRVGVDHPLVVRPKIRLHSLPPRLRLARENKMARKMGSLTGVGNSKCRVKLCNSHSNVWKCMQCKCTWNCKWKYTSKCTCKDDCTCTCIGKGKCKYTSTCKSTCTCKCKWTCDVMSCKWIQNCNCNDVNRKIYACIYVSFNFHINASLVKNYTKVNMVVDVNIDGYNAM